MSNQPPSSDADQAQGVSESLPTECFRANEGFRPLTAVCVLLMGFVGMCCAGYLAAWMNSASMVAMTRTGGQVVLIPQDDAPLTQQSRILAIGDVSLNVRQVDRTLMVGMFPVALVSDLTISVSALNVSDATKQNVEAAAAIDKLNADPVALRRCIAKSYVYQMSREDQTSRMVAEGRNETRTYYFILPTLAGALRVWPVTLAAIAATIYFALKRTFLCPGHVGGRRLSRGRCPRCGYVIVGARHGQCPECGIRWNVPPVVVDGHVH